MVSTRDIGIGGARAFEEPGRWKILDLAGDEIDMKELKATYREVMGQEVSPSHQSSGFVKFENG